MPYGIEIYGPNGGKLLDTSAYSHVQISNAVQTWSTSSNITVGSDEIIGIRYDASSSALDTALVHNVNPLVYTNNSGVTLEYIRLKFVRLDSALPTADNYGIECYDSSGNLIFGSRYTKAFKIETFFASGEATGGLFSTGAGGAAGEILYSGTDQDVFVTLQNPYFDPTTGAFDAEVIKNNFHFQTDGKIRLVSYFYFPFTATTNYYPNFSTIFTFTIRN